MPAKPSNPSTTDDVSQLPLNAGQAAPFIERRRAADLMRHLVAALSASQD